MDQTASVEVDKIYFEQTSDRTDRYPTQIQQILIIAIKQGIIVVIIILCVMYVVIVGLILVKVRFIVMKNIIHANLLSMHNDIAPNLCGWHDPSQTNGGHFNF